MIKELTGAYGNLRYLYYKKLISLNKKKPILFQSYSTFKPSVLVFPVYPLTTHGSLAWAIPVLMFHQPRLRFSKMCVCTWLGRDITAFDIFQSEAFVWFLFKTPTKSSQFEMTQFIFKWKILKPFFILVLRTNKLVETRCGKFEITAPWRMNREKLAFFEMWNGYRSAMIFVFA